MTAAAPVIAENTLAPIVAGMPLVAPAPAAPVAPVVERPDAWSDFQKDSQPARSAAEYDLHLAAYELDMADAISLQNFDEFLCKPKLNVQPFRHQIEAAITYFRHLAPRGLIADDVGLGKTICAGLITAELMARGRVRSLLIVCPRPLMDQWKGELANKFGISAECAAGSEFDRLRNHPCVITTYQTAAARIDDLTERGFDLVIMDEAHKLRTLTGPGTSSTMAAAFHKFMMNRGATFVLMLTATPLQNKLWDIHSLMEILSAPQPNPLGGEDEFAARFISDSKGSARKLSEEAQDDFRRRVGAYVSRKRRADVGLLFPNRLVLDRMEAPSLDEQLYLNECMGLLAALKLAPMEQCTFARSVLSSPAAAASSLKKMKFNMPGEFHGKADDLAERGLAFKSTTKSKALAELIRNLQKEDPNWRAIVFTQRKATLKFISQSLIDEGLGDHVCTFQGGEPDNNRKSIADFTAEHPRKRVFVATDAGAEGLNLQMCSVLINYDLPWNPMCVEQRIGRVQRLGQKAAAVVINNLVLSGTLEEKVVHRLMEKLDLFKCAVGEMEEVLSLSGATETATFELDILELIRKTLRKQDTDKEVELKKRSLEDARHKLSEMREATEEALGRLDPEDEVPAPKFERREARRTAREFALDALARRSRKVEPVGEHRLTVTPTRGSPVEFTFDRNDPAIKDPASPIKLLAPGTREFTELVDDWKGKAQVYAVNSVGKTRSVESLVDGWCTERGERVTGIRVLRRVRRMCAELTAYAKAAVYHDRYEGLVEVPLRYPEDGVDFALDADFPPANLPPAALGAEWWVHAKKALGRELDKPEKGLKQFCGYYTQRRTQQQVRLLRQVAGRLKLDITDHSTTERLLEKLSPRFGMDLSGNVIEDIDDMCRSLDDYKPGYKAAVQDIDIKNQPKSEVRPIGLRAIVYERATVAVEVVAPGESSPRTIHLDCVPLSGRVMPTAG